MNLNGWTASLIRSFDEIAGRIQLYMPSMLGAIGLLILGWVVGRLLRNWSVRLMARVERRLEGHAFRSASSRLGVERNASEVIGSFVFWAVFIIFLGAATDTLGLPVLATWLSGLSRFLPRLLLSALIVLAGVLAGTLVRDAISATRMTLGRTLGRGAQFAIITAAVIGSEGALAGVSSWPKLKFVKALRPRELCASDCQRFFVPSAQIGFASTR